MEDGEKKENYLRRIPWGSITRLDAFAFEANARFVQSILINKRVLSISAPFLFIEIENAFSALHDKGMRYVKLIVSRKKP